MRELRSFQQGDEELRGSMVIEFLFVDQGIVDFCEVYNSYDSNRKALRGSTGQQRGAISSVDQSTAEPRTSVWS